MKLNVRLRGSALNQSRLRDEPMHALDKLSGWCRAALVFSIVVGLFSILGNKKRDNSIHQ